MGHSNWLQGLPRAKRDPTKLDLNVADPRLVLKLMTRTRRYTKQSTTIIGNQFDQTLPSDARMSNPLDTIFVPLIAPVLLPVVAPNGNWKRFTRRPRSAMERALVSHDARKPIWKEGKRRTLGAR